MLGGDYHGSKVSLSNIFEGLGKYIKGQMSEADLAELEDAVCPTCGSCAGLFTANSMGCVMEALGLSLPGDATIPAPYSARLSLARQSGIAAVGVVREGWNIRRFITPVSIKNALAVDAALGCSTNTVLHLLAIANEAGVPLELETFNQVADRTPNIVKLALGRSQPDGRPAPSGRGHGRHEAAQRGQAGGAVLHPPSPAWTSRSSTGRLTSATSRSYGRSRHLSAHRRSGRPVRQPGA